MAATLLNNLIGSRFAAVKISSFLLKNGRLYFRVKVNTDVDDTNNNTNHDNCDDNTTTTTAHKSDTNTTEMKYWIALILRNNFSRFCLFLAPPPLYVAVCGCISFSILYLSSALWVGTTLLSPTCGQSYKQFTLVIYEFRVLIWGIFKSGTTLELSFPIVEPLQDWPLETIL